MLDNNRQVWIYRSLWSKPSEKWTQCTSHDNFSVGTLSTGSAVSIDDEVAEVPNWEVPLQVFHVDIRIARH